MARFLWYLVPFAVSATWAYIMDDTNTTILYAPSEKWQMGTDPREYNRTHTSATCFTNNSCTMILPFTGSGISLQVQTGWLVNYLVAVDEGQPSSNQLGKGVPLGQSPAFQFNVTAYNMQFLQLGDHHLNLTLISPVQSSISELSHPNGSVLIFDAAIVNETDAFPTAATLSMIPSPTATAAISNTSPTRTSTPNRTSTATSLPSDARSLIAIGNTCYGMPLIVGMLLVLFLV